MLHLFMLLLLMDPVRSLSPRRRRVVDLVFNSSISTYEIVNILPVFAARFPIQVHITSKIHCLDIVDDLKNRSEDDFLVLIGIQKIKCPKEICRTNFANIVLPAENNANKTVYYGCTEEISSVEYEKISRMIQEQQKEILLDDLPSEYKTNKKGHDKVILAGFAIMGLIILGLLSLLAMTTIKHSKEIKALKKVPETEENKTTETEVLPTDAKKR